MALTLELSNQGGGLPVAICSVYGIQPSGTLGIEYGAAFEHTSETLGTEVGTAFGTSASVVGQLPSDGYYYFRGWFEHSGTREYTPEDVLWVFSGGQLQRLDALTNGLVGLLNNDLMAINAAWRQFATAGTYTVGTILASDILVGDRQKPPEGRVTLCVLADAENNEFDGAPVGGFIETAHRTIRGYIDLVEEDETTSRETERERLRDTMRSAILDILMASKNFSFTDESGYLWQDCYPVSSDTGEVRKDNKTYWAFEITWQATTQGTR